MQSLTYRKKTSPFKTYRSDPSRFYADGVTFKAKLIGILEVGEARGDKMCQDALQDLKMAIRAAGEHKQRIIIHVTLDGLRLRDEKTNDSLYHHPVHKISFIAQDMNDSRAFGYIFGSPDSGHRFFGIKTDKAASLVVLAMRDLFQVVFELKKKEIEVARQTYSDSQRMTPLDQHQQPTSMTIRSSAATMDSASPSYVKSMSSEPSSSKGYIPKEMSPESVADLVDLEQELSSIQRGITQMERITPNEPPSKNSVDGAASASDPFGDSFTHFPPTYNLLPPPESSKSRHSKPLKPPEEISLSCTNMSNPTIASTTTPITSNSMSLSKSSNGCSAFTSTTSTVNQSTTVKQPAYRTYSDDPIKAAEEDWLRMAKSPSPCPQPPPQSHTTEDTPPASTINTSSDDNTGSTVRTVEIEPVVAAPTITASTNQFRDAFTDLDPLGTGKSKPYIDKKYFFQDLKNPPKKILRDLSERESVFSANFAGGNASTANMTLVNDLNYTEDETTFASSAEFTNTEIKGVDFAPNFPEPNAQSDYFHVAAVEVVDDPIIGNNRALLVSDNDPFSPRMKKFDQFDDDFTTKSNIHDPFEFAFPNSNEKESKNFAADEQPNKMPYQDKPINDFNGPLQVNLPPESHYAKRLERHSSDAGDSSSTGSSRNRPGMVFKQNTVDNVINSISAKKMKPHLFSSQKYSKRESNSINMRRLQESDSLSETESAPEPPPRPQDIHHHQADPPPLPPKKPFSDIHIRLRSHSPSKQPSNEAASNSRYAYTPISKDEDPDSPALPLPSRRISRSTDQNYPGPSRPAKKMAGGASSNNNDDYLTPIGSAGAPILLPPPQNRGSTKNRGRRQPEPMYSLDVSNLPPSAANMTYKNRHSFLPDITLSELLTLGIDELANKLNVPVDRLSTMNIVDLTQYLSDFIAQSFEKSPPASTKAPATTSNNNHNRDRAKTSFKDTTPEAAIFKVSFDADNEATFIAKFDDNFGDTSPLPNFANFDCSATTVAPVSVSNPPQSSVDRYAVFREIMDQDQCIGGESQSVAADDEEPQNDSSCGSEEQNSDSNEEVAPPPKVEATNITQVIAQAKDRYAALRDIIMIEDLFDTTANLLHLNNPVPDLMSIDIPSTVEDEAAVAENTTDDSDTQRLGSDENEKQSSPEINISMTMDSPTFEQPAPDKSLVELTTTSSKDDLEIDEYMNRAISNLSLDSRDHLSPISNHASKSPLPLHRGLHQPHLQQQHASTSPIRMLQPTINADTATRSTKTLNNMSTSPIPTTTYPISILSKSPLSKSPIDQIISGVSLSPRSPVPHSAPNGSAACILDARNRSLNSAGSLSDVVLCGSSPDVDKNIEMSHSDQVPTSESWAVFEAADEEEIVETTDVLGKSPKLPPPKKKGTSADSPCSSDDKNDWKTATSTTNEQEYHKRWPHGHTSSSSRDLSPWDDDAPPPLASTAAADFRRRTAQPDRHGFYMRHARRMHSGDDEYEYDEEMAGRRERRMHQHKPPTGRGSRDTFESGDPANWYQSHSWSPADDEDSERARQFNRSTYERSTYGPPYEKRGGGNGGADAYDRGSGYKMTEKRRFYRGDYPRSSEYDFDMYADDEKAYSKYDDYDSRLAKGRREYEGSVYDQSPGFSRTGGPHKSAKEYFYDREKRSFDRESNESFESSSRRRKSYGSGDVYGSLDSREEYRERYMDNKTRSLRKAPKPDRLYQEYAQDSDGEVVIVSKDRISRRTMGGAGDREMDSRSLQRPPHGSTRPRKSSGSSPWDGEDLTPTSSQKSWKRPSSATESEKKIAERRGIPPNTLAGSDGEKERRFRKKIRSRAGKDMESRSAYATMRQPSNRSSEFTGGYEPPEYENDDYRGSRRKLDSAMSSAGRSNVSSIDRRRKDQYDFDDDPRDNIDRMQKLSRSNRDVYYASNDEKEHFDKFESFDDTPVQRHPKVSSGQSAKFNYDDDAEQQGFESDFNSPPSGGKSLRFSNDFSDKERHAQQPAHHQQLSAIASPSDQTSFADRTTPTSAVSAQKLRFDETVTVAKFDRNAEQLFEDDDFSKAEFTFENEDMWGAQQLPKKNNLKHHHTTQQQLQQPTEFQPRTSRQQENIKKSESVNIFAKKVDDPFEDDDFFKVTGDESSTNAGPTAGGESNGHSSFKWEKNFAKFEENI